MDADPRLRGPNPWLFSEDFWLELCSRVQARVRVLAPERGYLHRTAYAEALRARFARLRQATWEDAPDCGHHLHAEAPERVAAALRALLGEAT